MVAPGPTAIAVGLPTVPRGSWPRGRGSKTTLRKSQTDLREPSPQPCRIPYQDVARMRSRLGSVEVQTGLLEEGSGRRAEGYCFDAPLSLETCST